MTLDELADLSADKLEKLTDKELIEILSPYFNVTRPEMVTRVERKQQYAPMPTLSPQKQQALALLQEQGVDISFMRRKKR